MTLIRLAGTAAASAVSAGLAFIGIIVLTVRTIQPPVTDAAQIPQLGFPFYLLVFGTFGGVVLTAVIAWLLLGRLGSTYRQGGLAMVSALATVVAMLLCMPVDRAFGRLGLVGLIVVSATAAILLARRAHRAEVV